jgi:hypothetical protein
MDSLLSFFNPSLFAFKGDMKAYRLADHLSDALFPGCLRSKRLPAWDSQEWESLGSLQAF